ncbi:3D domain-containing protein [Geosporobacter ferrireducens]|uniref:G5 domain-containing protein n=1 Tax=Geosporobacter ferrireducens TaxID=1424294 RepID=A0A1D8GH86_9FIRM|nr:3D domain-containing protein [Geosporobacter ferrireducens]AOT70273.1 hypothetical protein Gferi_12110 [Geosporobacter ferrireducens]MTI55765.1 DUF348 domain-containing protein [Geosporobacter ferrireducens]
METDRRIDKLLTKKNLIILGIVLVIGIFSVSSALTKEITIKDGDKDIVVAAKFSNVEEVLKKGKIELTEHDQVLPALDTKVNDGMAITIKRAHPVNLEVDGETKEVMTAYETIGDILKEYEITLGESDRVEPEMEAVIMPYDTIKVIRIEEKRISEKVVIPYQSIIKHNDSLDKGKANVIQKGKNGEKQVEYVVLYENGEEVSKILKEEKILVAAENEVVEKGTAQYLATSRGAVRFRNAIKMSSTAYDASFESTGKNPGDKHYGLTKSGTKVRPGVVAVDPKVIPLGTKLYIKSLDSKWPDYGFAIAEDTGGAIKGNKIDLYFENTQDVKRYGRRNVEVYVLE